MTKVYTIDLPGKYTHCTLNDDRTDNGKHIAEQVFYNEDKIISKLEIYFDKAAIPDGELARYPYKIILRDYDSVSTIVTEEE